MKRRILTIAMIFAMAGTLLLGGCGKRSSEIQGGSGLSTEVEATSTADGAATLNSTWYDYDGNYLTGFTVTIKSGSEVIFNQEVNENGQIPEFSVPTNTEVNVLITNASGAELASSKLKFSVSVDYPQMVIIPPENGVAEIQLPSGATAINVSLFVNKDGEVAFSSSSRNRGSASSSSTETVEDTDTDGEGSGSAESESADSEDSNSEE